MSSSSRSILPCRRWKLFEVRYSSQDFIQIGNWSPYLKKSKLALQNLHLTTQLAYAQKGVTVDKELYNPCVPGMSRRQARHYVFTRDGLNCHTCEGLITHTRLSGRRLDYCSNCQH